MSIDYLATNLVDLISERHKELRNKVRIMWKESGGEDISNTETYILSLVENKEITMAEIARIIGISRQGVHKCVKNLVGKGYLQIESMDNSQKEKVVKLTIRGQECCNSIYEIKKEIEEEIKENIGEERIELLRDILKTGVINHEKK